MRANSLRDSDASLRMNIKIAESDSELALLSEVLLELRPAFDKRSLIDQIKAQQREGYRVAYLESAGEVRCVAGFVIGTKLAWGRHMYVDDLVTAERHRSTGVGARMMDWLKSHALAQGCRQLHLDSGVQRFGAHRFYLREGFNIGSHHFSITDLSESEHASTRRARRP
jgi:GNAT superfamily N-acetyltransferase